MLSVAEAQALVLLHSRPLPPVEAPLSPAVLGWVLAEDVASDLDMPPFDKSLMDGYAVRCADLLQGHGVLTVIEEIVAGQTPKLPVRPGQATRIMTGAPVPAGADAVVMVERTRQEDDGRVQIDDRPPQPGQNILVLGREMRRGETVLAAGALFRAQEFGLLATVGRTSARLHPAPQVAVLSTGDELVDAAQAPGPGQIHNSNGPMLLAQVAGAGGQPRSLGIARDHLDSLRPLVAQGLQAEILILSGGVSAGKLDLVPGVLQQSGVQAHFHKVAMKPGKPVFFGTRDATLVFGLPGNPVSVLVCFELFVRPAMRRLGGHADPGPRMIQAALTEDFSYQTDRPTYYPGRLEEGPAGRQFRPVAWFGSPDLRALTQANAFGLIAPGEHHFRAGAQLEVLGCEG